MERFVIEDLNRWNEDPRRKPLLLNGARQVGKTWLLRRFGERSFRNVAYVNFDGNPAMQSQFQQGYDLKRIVHFIEAVTRQPVRPGQTLLILDEIHACPEALTSLKYFCEQMPELAVAAVGSFLGSITYRGTGFPVGKVNLLYLYPLSFREYLDAVGEKPLRELIDEGDPEILTSLAQVLTDHLRSYMYVGGMPEAVLVFADDHDYEKARQVQAKILAGYERDITKQVPGRGIERTLAVWKSIPHHLAQENRHFVFGHIREGARAKNYREAIRWLSEAGIAVLVKRVREPLSPLKAYAQESGFKLFMLDVGLLGAMSGLDEKTLLDGGSVFEQFNGSLTEQFVCQELRAAHRLTPYYWKGENVRAEVDFAVQMRQEIYAIEVKAAENLRSKSLRAFHDKFPHARCLRFSLSDWREQDWMRNVPLFAISNKKLWDT